MQSLQGLQRAQPTVAPAEQRGPDRGPGQILLGVFETLERAGIPYCVLHGYESYPRLINSDVDCLISAEVSPDQVAALLHANRDLVGAEVIRSRGYYFLLAGKDTGGSTCFLELDLGVNYELCGRQFYSGREVLGSRRRHQQFWVSAAHIEFGCYLIKKIAKGRLNDEHGGRLSALFRQDPAGCRQQVARFWSARGGAVILAAADSGDWQPVRRCLGKLWREVSRRATFRHPVRVLDNWLRRIASRVRHGIRPDSGLDVVFLGPDGAGKSSVVKAVVRQLGGGFGRTACYSFPPSLLERFHRRPEGPDPLPHAAPIRSRPASVVRALGYWFIYHTLGYLVTVHLALARAALVVHDRHLIDALVDPRRYRYGGPLWLLRLILRFVPRADLVILLDAPAEVLQRRKQEVPFAETARQLEAYRTLVRTMSHAHVVDASLPLDRVVGEVNDIILRHLASRMARRHGLELAR